MSEKDTRSLSLPVPCLPRLQIWILKIHDPPCTSSTVFLKSSFSVFCFSLKSRRVSIRNRKTVLNLSPELLLPEPWVFRQRSLRRCAFPALFVTAVKGHQWYHGNLLPKLKRLHEVFRKKSPRSSPFQIRCFLPTVGTTILLSTCSMDSISLCQRHSGYPGKGLPEVAPCAYLPFAFKGNLLMCINFGGPPLEPHPHLPNPRSYRRVSFTPRQNLTLLGIPTS